MSLWRALLDLFRGQSGPDDLRRVDEPDEPYIAAIPYPTADVLGERAAARGEAEPPPDENPEG